MKPDLKISDNVAIEICTVYTCTPFWLGTGSNRQTDPVCTPL